MNIKLQLKQLKLINNVIEKLKKIIILNVNKLHTYL